MKNVIFILLIVSFQSCKSKTSNGVNQPSINSATKEPESLTTEETPNNSVNRDSVNIFLERPFDYFKLKKIIGSPNSTGDKQKEYYKKPSSKGFYYQYFLFSDLRGYLGNNKARFFRKEDGIGITVYKKLGEYQYKFIDPTEELIELRMKYNILKLPELAFVGLDSLSILKRFGEPDLYRLNSMVYQHKNKALILNLKKNRVRWLKYVNLKEGLDLSKNTSIFNIE